MLIYIKSVTNSHAVVPHTPLDTPMLSFFLKHIVAPVAVILGLWLTDSKEILHHFSSLFPFLCMLAIGLVFK